MSPGDTGVPARTFIVAAGGDAFAIPLPFDPRAAFGKVHAPVTVAVNGLTYRSTVTTMGGRAWVPFRKDRRDAAGAAEGEAFEVTLTLDSTPRTVEPPRDLRAALEAAGLLQRWASLSFTHQREHAEAVDGAKKPDTRARRIARCVAHLR